ncbi:MAG: hypothetical protein WCK10_03490 [Candidatus Staskawiczbacteria bacterium]
MKKHNKVSLKEKNKYLILVLVVVSLLVILGVYFLYIFFNNSSFPSKVNKYLIENKYYSFKLQTPKGWTVMEKTVYSEDKIVQLLEECKTNKTTNEIGAFRLESLKYPEDLASLESTTNDPREFLTGAILELSINCLPNDIKVETNNDLKFGSVIHKNLKYIITKNIYVSSGDKSNESKIKENFNKVFNKIISSFTFIK